MARDACTSARVRTSVDLSIASIALLNGFLHFFLSLFCPSLFNEVSFIYALHSWVSFLYFYCALGFGDRIIKSILQFLLWVMEQCTYTHNMLHTSIIYDIRYPQSLERVDFGLLVLPIMLDRHLRRKPWLFKLWSSTTRMLPHMERTGNVRVLKYTCNKYIKQNHWKPPRVHAYTFTTKLNRLRLPPPHKPQRHFRKVQRKYQLRLKHLLPPFLPTFTVLQQRLYFPVTKKEREETDGFGCSEFAADTCSRTYKRINEK